MRRLQNVPGDRGRVHATAQHGDHIGGEHVTQCSLLQNGAHISTLNEKHWLPYQLNGSLGLISNSERDCAKTILAGWFLRGSRREVLPYWRACQLSVGRLPGRRPWTVPRISAPAPRFPLVRR